MLKSVGVIIPTFNRPAQTVRAVRSVLEQTLRPTRILVIDDGSGKDNRIKLRSELATLDVELAEIEHTGHPGIVRKVGVEILDTDWIAFLDSDDEWLPRKLELQIQKLNESRNLACSSNAILRSSGQYFFNENIIPPSIMTSDLIKVNSIICSSSIIAKSELTKINGFADTKDVRGAEDYATWLRVSLLTNWDYLKEPLVIYSDESEDSLRMEISKTVKSSHLVGLENFSQWIKPRFDIRLRSRIVKMKILQIVNR